MKILMINKADKIGGAAQVAWNLKQEWQNLGHSVKFFVCDKTTADPDIIKIPRSRFRFYLSHLLGTDIDLFKTDYLLNTPEFKEADVVSCHNLHGHYFNLKTLLKMSKLKPVAWTLHDMWALTPYCSHSFGEPNGQGFYACDTTASKSWVKTHNQAYLQARKQKIYQDLKINLVAPSAWLQEKIQHSVLAKQATTLIHNGIKLDNYLQAGDKAAWRRKLNLPQDKKIVLFASAGGKDNIWKGWQYAQEVVNKFKNNPDILFVCLGGFENNNDADNLKFVDYIDDEKKLAKYFLAADAFLLTSTAESFGLVILEAMAAGLPVVSFKVGVAPEVIKHQNNGYIAKYLSASDLAEGLSQVLAFDREKLQAIKLSNQELIKQEFKVAGMAQKYLDLYEKIIADFKK